MAFQIKDFTSIVASMINWAKSTQTKVTDFNVGSVVRTLIEAPAIEIDELYQQMFIGLKEAIPVATYNSFNFAALPAIAASGLVRVTIASSASATVIPAGTVFSYENGAVSYTSSQDVTIAAGNTYADVLVIATQAGVVGNITASTAFTVQPTVNGFVSATNLSPFINGAYAETEDARKIRFGAYVQSLNRGTVAALMYGLKTTALTDASGNLKERVVAASVVEPWLTDSNQPISLVNCYVHNGVGSTSSALVTQAKAVVYGYYDSNGNAVPGWKAAGVHVEVYAATEQTVNVTATLTADAGYDKPTLVSQATQAIFAYIQGLDIGATAIKSEIIALVMNIPGVVNFIPTAPSSDVTATNQVKLMPGTITIT